MDYVAGAGLPSVANHGGARHNHMLVISPDGPTRFPANTAGVRWTCEGLEQREPGSALSPIIIINADLAEVLLLAHSYDECIQQSRKAIEMDPPFPLAHNQLAQAYLQTA